MASFIVDLGFHTPAMGKQIQEHVKRAVDIARTQEQETRRIALAQKDKIIGLKDASIQAGLAGIAQRDATLHTKNVQISALTQEMADLKMQMNNSKSIGAALLNRATTSETALAAANAQLHGEIARVRALQDEKRQSDEAAGFQLSQAQAKIADLEEKLRRAQEGTEAGSSTAASRVPSEYDSDLDAASLFDFQIPDHL